MILQKKFLEITGCSKRDVKKFKKQIRHTVIGHTKCEKAIAYFTHDQPVKTFAIDKTNLMLDCSLMESCEQKKKTFFNEILLRTMSWS